jgi:hypothetical protein
VKFDLFDLQLAFFSIKINIQVSEVCKKIV